MGRYPRALWKPLPEAGHEYTATRKRLLVMHSIVGSATSAFNFFRDGTDLESTWILPYQGAPWQVMETSDSADANFHANSFALSVETEDNKNPNIDPWTASQLDELVALGIWCVRSPEFDIPAKRATGPYGEGIGYHSMWGAPSDWTPAVGKTCPGTIRIRQFNEIVLPRIIAESVDPPPVIVEEDMRPIIWNVLDGGGLFFELAGVCTHIVTPADFYALVDAYKPTITPVLIIVASAKFVADRMAV